MLSIIRIAIFKRDKRKHPTCHPCQMVYRAVQPCAAVAACCNTVPGSNPLESDNRKSLDHPGKFHRNCNLQWGKECTCFRDIRVERQSSRILDGDSWVHNLMYKRGCINKIIFINNDKKR